MSDDNFGRLLSAFLSDYLPAQRNMSPNTIRSYRDAFVLLLRFCRDRRNRNPARLRMRDINSPLILAFLEHLERERRCSVSTRNQRLAAIHSFACFAQTECPRTLLELQRILLIPPKRHERREVRYLDADDTAAILRQPGMATPRGRRDTTLLSVLYDTGARVQEIIDLKVRDVRLESPAQVVLTGKGRKMRSVPIMGRTAALLRDYLRDNRLDRPECADRPVFQNRYGRPLSRSGVRHVLQKHAERARSERPTIPERLSPHTLRHTKAMHLLQAGNPLVVIRNILGHADVKTSEIYARADMTMKRRALETVADMTPSPQAPSWTKDASLIEWLHAL